MGRKPNRTNDAARKTKTKAITKQRNSYTLNIFLARAIKNFANYTINKTDKPPSLIHKPHIIKFTMWTKTNKPNFT